MRIINITEIEEVKLYCIEYFVDWREEKENAQNTQTQEGGRQLPIELVQ